ncbi:glycosyltransferase [Thermodesulfobacterium sp.]|uniref:glycosyltransferase n=1 Tax=Thermodesulfobacterium sp. TaxID=1965289 RepID=UPI00257F9F85|nr:glycosyltransferase [Thermodesulfobacterium sp.]
MVFLVSHLGSGGAERVVANLSHGIKDYENYIVIFEKVVKQEVNGEIFVLNSPSSQNLIRKIINLPIRFFRLKGVKKRIKPFASISFLEPMNFYNTITKVEKEKIILSFHSNYTNTFLEDPFLGKGLTRKFLNLAYKAVLRILYNKADFLIAVSKDVASDLIENFGMDQRKIKVIYNPYPIEDIKVILGEGELKDYLVELSESLGLKTFVWDRDKLSEDFDVYFLGFQKNPFKFIARSKFFVFPSLWEGFGNVLVESMACGVPVVSSDCRSGPREILAPNTRVCGVWCADACF